MIYLSNCIDLDECDISLGGAFPEGWVSPWLDSTMFCACASTLFMREAIYKSFSSIVLVSLTMTRAISASCSSMDVVPVTITNMVTEKEEVKELEWLDELFRFDIPVGELVLELASGTKYKDLSLKSFIVEWCFSLPWELYLFTPKEAKVMSG